MNILGVYDGHNANAALVSNGEIIAAVEEERFSRVKNHMDREEGPINSIRYCLEECNNRVDAIALALDSPSKLHENSINSYFESINNGFTERLKCDNIYGKKVLPYDIFMYPFSAQKRAVKKVLSEVSSLGLDVENIPIYYINHHLAHASSAYYNSPYDDCLIATLDGKGDDLCGFLGIGLDGEISQIGSTNYIYSICILYSLITSICGFKPLRHEGKITGLAARGNPNQRLIREFERLIYTKDGKWYGTLDSLNKLGPYPHTMREENHLLVMKVVQSIEKKWKTSDIAASIQKFYEDQVTSYIDFHMKETSKESLVLAGGGFANVKLNQAIYEMESIKKIHIHPAMSDAGLGVGAALMVCQQNDRKLSPKPLLNAFLGPDYSTLQIERKLSEYNLEYSRPNNIYTESAKILSLGKVLARFDGRLEYGPRALGNRSILYQTTDKKVNDWLNKKLKRTEFMPFAPVTLSEFFYDCYVTNCNEKELNTYQFMTITVNCSQKMKELSPAVVHIDGTARPQIVSKSNNPGLYEILSSYYELTGNPSLINTSFNPHEEPIVCTPEDAIKAFIECELDFLQIGPFIVSNNKKDRNINII